MSLRVIWDQLQRILWWSDTRSHILPFFRVAKLGGGALGCPQTATILKFRVAIRIELKGIHQRAIVGSLLLVSSNAQFEPFFAIICPTKCNVRMIFWSTALKGKKGIGPFFIYSHIIKHYKYRKCVQHHVSFQMISKMTIFGWFHIWPFLGTGKKGIGPRKQGSRCGKDGEFYIRYPDTISNLCAKFQLYDIFFPQSLFFSVPHSDY